jgi:6-phospho-3-hexuloisomerase
MQHVESTIDVKAGKIKIQELVDTVLKENRSLMQTLSDEAVEDFIQRILNAKSIFFAAQGRSGFILRCFCMRLMHLGLQVYFCGETITPAIGGDDLLIVLSGSGETASTLEAVRSAGRCNAATCAILGNLDSGIGALVNVSIHLPGTTKLCRDIEPPSLQMAGSLFEQSAFLFLEAVVLNLYRQRKKDVDRISSRHAVIE